MFIFEIRSYGIHMQTKPKIQLRYLCENYKFSVKNDIFKDTKIFTMISSHFLIGRSSN